MHRIITLCLGLSVTAFGSSKQALMPEVRLSQTPDADGTTGPSTLFRFSASECRSLSTEDEGKIRTFLPSLGTYCEIFESVLSISS